MTKRFVAYYRVSTDRQGQSGLGLEAQEAAVHAHIKAAGGQLLAQFKEIESGKNNDRPVLAKALHRAKVTGATLVVAKLDRLARNVAFMSRLMESGIDFIACDNPHANRLTIHLLAAVAEHEREAISQRTKAALAAAKARGTPLGNPMGVAAFGAVTNVASCVAKQKKAAARALDLRDVLDEIRAAGISTYRGIAAELDNRGILPARGSRWHATSVRNLILRR